MNKGCPRPIVVSCVFVLLCLSSRTSWAGDAAQADRYFEQGKALLDAGDWEGACEKFELSQAADASVSTQVKLARCDAHFGHLEDALSAYGQALELNGKLPGEPERVAQLQEVILREMSDLEAQIARRTPPQNDVAEGDENSSAGPVELAPPPKQHDQSGSDRSATESRAPPTLREQRSGVTRVLAWTLAGFGVALGGGAVGYGVSTLSLVDRSGDHCHPTTDICNEEGFRLREKARNHQSIGIALGATGALLVGTSLGLWLTTKKSNHQSARLTFGVGSIALSGDL